MKLAFSTLASPTWDFETIAARAKEFGYDGVELRGFLDTGGIKSSFPVFIVPSRSADINFPLPHTHVLKRKNYATEFITLNDGYKERVYKESVAAFGWCGTA